MITIVLLTLALLPVPSVGTAGECAAVQIIGVRGSGQSGYGQQVGGVVADLERRISDTGRSVLASALDYPAISVSDSFGLVLLNGEYEASVRRGADSLRIAIDDISTRCPDTQIVLVGYSQGAQVIKVAMENTLPEVRIGAVGLLADPTREPSQPGVVRLGGRSGLRGGSFGAIPLPGYLRPVTVDVCAPEDSICERGGFGFVAHVEGYAGFSETVALRLMPFIVAHRVSGLVIR
ncbi:MAG: cutinase family protein [Acidimicrobiia bacterium]